MKFLSQKKYFGIFNFTVPYKIKPKYHSKKLYLRENDSSIAIDFTQKVLNAEMKLKNNLLVLKVKNHHQLFTG